MRPRCLLLPVIRALVGQGNLVGGHSPVWHEAAGGSTQHVQAAAITGIRSKEWGGAGYSLQLEIGLSVELVIGLMKFKSARKTEHHLCVGSNRSIF